MEFLTQSWLIASFVTVVDNSSRYELEILFSVFLVYFGVELKEYDKCFILHGKVASLIRQSGLLSVAHYFFNAANQKL